MYTHRLPPLGAYELPRDDDDTEANSTHVEPSPRGSDERYRPPNMEAKYPIEDSLYETTSPSRNNAPYSESELVRAPQSDSESESSDSEEELLDPWVVLDLTQAASQPSKLHARIPDPNSLIDPITRRADLCVRLRKIIVAINKATTLELTPLAIEKLQRYQNGLKYLLTSCTTTLTNLTAPLGRQNPNRTYSAIRFDLPFATDQEDLNLSHDLQQFQNSIKNLLLMCSNLRPQDHRQLSALRCALLQAMNVVPEVINLTEAFLTAQCRLRELSLAEKVCSFFCCRATAATEDDNIASHLNEIIQTAQRNLIYVRPIHDVAFYKEQFAVYIHQAEEEEMPFAEWIKGETQSDNNESSEAFPNTPNVALLKQIDSGFNRFPTIFYPVFYYLTPLLENHFLSVEDNGTTQQKIYITSLQPVMSEEAKAVIYSVNLAVCDRDKDITKIQDVEKNYLTCSLTINMLNGAVDLHENRTSTRLLNLPLALTCEPILRQCEEKAAQCLSVDEHDAIPGGHSYLAR